MRRGTRQEACQVFWREQEGQRKLCSQEGREASLQVATHVFCMSVASHPLLHDSYQGRQGLQWSFQPRYGFILVGPEQEGIRRMSKLDLPILLLTYLLRITYLLLLLYVRFSSRLYNYWFNTMMLQISVPMLFAGWSTSSLLLLTWHCSVSTFFSSCLLVLFNSYLSGLSFPFGHVCIIWS